MLSEIEELTSSGNNLRSQLEEAESNIEHLQEQQVTLEVKTAEAEEQKDGK